MEVEWGPGRVSYRRAEKAKQDVMYCSHCRTILDPKGSECPVCGEEY